MKVLYIYTCKAIFDFTSMGLNLLCQGMWVVWDRAELFSERGVIGSQRLGIFCWLPFFVGIEKNGLTELSRIATTIARYSHPPSQPRASMLEKL